MGAQPRNLDLNNKERKIIYVIMRQAWMKINDLPHGAKSLQLGGGLVLP
jgi:hypothetical protein